MPSNNYSTLHKDIELTEKEYGLWDINFQNGDLKSATDKNSLRTGLIMSCLTSWNYLNNKGNPTYETFGNRAYEELKKKKSSMVKYKIQQYFIEVLNRIRRVQNVESLEVQEIQNYPNDYFVKFTVTALNDELVTGSFTITTDLKKQDSQINTSILMPFATNTKPLKAEIQLCNEYGTGISGEILYIYIKEHDSPDYKFYRITEPTDEDGYIRLEYNPPKREDNNYGETMMLLVFRGNTTHNGCESLPVTFNTDYREYRLQILTEDYSTSTEDNHILFKLEEKSLKDNSYEPIRKETVYVKGNDGSFYEVTTNSEGVGRCEVSLEQDTTYTIAYSTLKEQITITVIQTSTTLNFIEEPPAIGYINTSYTFKLQVLTEDNRQVKNMSYTIKQSGKTVQTGKTDNRGVITCTYQNNKSGQVDWTVETGETSFFTESTITFQTETVKYSPLIGLNVQKSANNRMLHISFDYEHEDNGGHITFGETPNEQLLLMFEEDKVKIDFNKTNSRFEWTLSDAGIEWTSKDNIMLIVEENITTDNVYYDMVININDIEERYSITVPKTTYYTSFDNLIYDKSSNITNITNNHTLTCYNEEFVLLESKVCNLPLLSDNPVHFYIEDTEIASVPTSQKKANLTYNLNMLSTGTYDLQAKINESTDSHSAESYITKINIIEHDYNLEYEQINNYTIKFTFTDGDNPVKDKKVRLYSEETGYEKALYTDNEGTCTFTDVIYGGLYNYTCETFSGTIQNGYWESLMGSLRTASKSRNANTSYEFSQDSSVLRIINRSTSEEGYLNVLNIISLNSSKELEIEMASDIPYYGIFFGEHDVFTFTGVDVIEVDENEIYINVQMKDRSNYIPVPSNEMMINEYSPIKLRFKIYSDNYMRGYYNGFLLGEWELEGNDIHFMVGAGGTLYISNFKILITE